MTTHTSLFPVTLQAQWKPVTDLSRGMFENKEVIEQTLHAGLVDWLLDPSSLTARLKSHCSDFRVEVLGQHITQCDELEANADILVGEEMLVREVLLFCDNKPQVFARSLLPLKSLTGEEQQLAELGAQPLGQILFNDPNLIRKGIELASFDHSSKLSVLVKALGLSQLQPLWGRRSVFVLKNKPIMVAEVFLPNAFAYQTSPSNKNNRVNAQDSDDSTLNIQQFT